MEAAVPPRLARPDPTPPRAPASRFRPCRCSITTTAPHPRDTRAAACGVDSSAHCPRLASAPRRDRRIPANLGLPPPRLVAAAGVGDATARRITATGDRRRLRFPLVACAADGRGKYPLSSL
ncbi:hypothetical protein PR202_gb21356 [Eleusine coracana subsp. coracana]|uniref:Uncharacterized protein n=1 Tax=Eleusine coracana subsp. coracana TaxID=191504 RepID=A0AAV5FDF0_ELECO|nr:hypothetical protein PR202_gb21356 [Eleusine coracana subsp. coracana]